jgi:hypothetical protein
MTIDEFINRIEQTILAVNSNPNLGTNTIGILPEDRLDILAASTIDEAAKYLIAADIPQYIIDFALSGQDISELSADEVSLAAAAQQVGMMGQYQNPNIGVPVSYIPPRPDATDFYTEDNLIGLFAGLPPEEIAGIQADLMNAGLLNLKDGFVPGDWDEKTQLAFTPVLSRANRRGVTAAEKEDGSAWRLSLEDYVANPVPDIPEEQVYLPPDYATIAQKVKYLFESDLNRKPKPSELKLLSNTMYKESEAAYEQSEELGDVAEQEPVFTAEGLMQKDYGNYAAENVEEKIDAGGLTQIDAESRMKESFDILTAREKERLGDNYSARNTRATILNSIANRPA